nr:glycosyltransferase [uncultured Carboxylicivirga sp.]
MAQQLNQMQFTIVSTIYNEAARLEQTIADLEAQTLKPSEIIITDAGSKDGSIEILEEWKQYSTIKITVLIEKGCNVARGRNLAIEKAHTEWIVSTDFGCRFQPQWLESLLTPLLFTKSYNLNPNDIQVIGGSFSVMESDIQTKAARANYILSGGYQPILNEGFIPSSRSIAYKKEIWQQVGGYSEWLTLAADDLVFGLKIQSQNIPIELVDKPYVYWGRHEKRQQYNRESYRYGLGDGEAKVNYKNFWSNLIETGLRYGFFTTLIIWICIITIDLYTKAYSLKPISYLPIGLITFITLSGLRSYYGAFKNWLKFKSKKYNFGTFCYALLMLEQQRTNYLRGYIKGYWYSSEKVKTGAQELHQFLSHEL